MKKIISYLNKKFWIWPDGFVWKITEKAILNSRKKKFEFFMSIMTPKPEETILDVGVSSFVGRATNFLELWYPHPENITALTNENEERFNEFKKQYPLCNLVFGDGKDLKFADNEFDIVFSNAVIEHLGREQEQNRFMYEILRVCKRAFITTPNYWFPIDSHTLIPFAHWLPQRIKYPVYKILGRDYWADINRLNLMTPKQFLKCFPSDVTVKLHKQRIFGITAILIAVVEKKR